MLVQYEHFLLTNFKTFVKMNKSSIYLKCFLLIIVIGLSSGCSSDVDNDQDEQIFNTLKDNQAKFIFKLDGKDFYKSENIFDSHLELYKTTFSLGCFDQFESNVLIHFFGPNIYSGRPIKVPIILENDHTSTIMFGKIKDKAQNLGEGYLMSEGFITFKALSREKVVMKIEGKAKKYPKTKETDPTFEVSALFVCKKPEMGYIDIDEKKVFY